MKVLITGANGLVGSWLFNHLSFKFEVTGLVRPSADLFRIDTKHHSKIIKAPVEDWCQVLKKTSFETAILSHWKGVENTYRNDSNQEKNIALTLNFAECASNNGVRNIIGMGSQAELGPVGHAVSEQQTDAPTSAYGRSKVHARVALEKLSQEKNFRMAWMRIFSVYGPLDVGDWLIPNTIRALLLNQEMKLTEGSQIWSYLYMSDLVSAFEVTLNTPELHGTIDVGNPSTVRVREVTELISMILRKQSLLKYGEIPFREDQVMLMQPLCKKLLSVGWAPQVSLEEGLRSTINWFNTRM
jgi:nucleoside-diphosphate-sugar epimerase